MGPHQETQFTPLQICQAQVLAAYLMGQAQIAQGLRHQGYNLGLALAQQAQATQATQPVVDQFRFGAHHNLAPGAKIVKTSAKNQASNMVTWRNKSKWRK